MTFGELSEEKKENLQLEDSKLNRGQKAVNFAFP